MHLQRESFKSAFRAIFLASLVSYSSALTQTWDVTMDYRFPDCVRRPVILINGEFPGPVLRIQPGEKVEILINNHIPNLPIAVHFHGQNQVGTPYMDGTSMVSSCPTGPHQSFKYEFTANADPGTFMYHLHVPGMRHMGMYGMFIAEDRPQDPLYMENLAGEHLLVFGDWYHVPFQDMVTGLVSTSNWVWPAQFPDALLINGQGASSGCTLAAVQQISPQCQHCPIRETLQVTAGGQYRLRFGSQTSQSDLNIAIENHTMTVIEVDGHPISPVKVTSLEVSAGQRYSVLLDADQPAASYHVSVGHYDSNKGISHHLGSVALTYASAPATDRGAPSQQLLSRLHAAAREEGFGRRQQAGYRALPGATPIAPSSNEVTRQVVLDQTREYFDAGVQKNSGSPAHHCNNTDSNSLRYATNRATYQDEGIPVALSVYSGDTATLTADRGYYAIKRGEVVEVVLQNVASCSGNCSAHPWHLHGHHFWVVGQGDGEWTGSAAQLASLDSDSAVYRDTVNVHSGGKGEPGTPCGWVVIRFRADNPGAWSFHCHLEWHAVMGMSTVFWYDDGSLPAPPADMPCWHPDGHAASDESSWLAAVIVAVVGVVLALASTLVLAFVLRWRRKVSTPLSSLLADAETPKLAGENAA